MLRDLLVVRRGYRLLRPWKQAPLHVGKRVSTRTSSTHIFKTVTYGCCMTAIYKIMINLQLSIYTSMNHSLLLLKLLRAYAQLFRHPV